MPDDDLLSSEESLFTAPGILEIEYLPRLLPYREEQQKYLAECIKKLPGLGTNVLIRGPPGIGKTACIRWVFRELKESEDSDVVPVYINCWRDSDEQRMVFTLCRHFGVDTAYRNQNELLGIILNRLKGFKAVVIAFDEIDRIHDQTFLYHFLEEIPHKCIFMVSTKKDWLSELDERVRSRLMPNMIEFKPYDIEQTKGILEERKNHAFVQGIWNPDAFEAVVSKCYQRGDIRTGLTLLKASGLAAEREASRKITIEHVKEALKRLELKKAPESGGKEKKITDFG